MVYIIVYTTPFSSDSSELSVERSSIGKISLTLTYP